MPTAAPISVSMREFLRTGAFGPLTIGDSAEKLKNTLGDPHEVGGSSRRHRAPGIWKYGDVEFHLTDDRRRIWLIFCDTYETLHLGGAASLDGWFFKGHPSSAVVENELNAAQMSFSREGVPHEPSAYVLRVQSGVELLFSTGTEEFTWPGRPGLFGFQYSDKRAV